MSKNDFSKGSVKKRIIEQAIPLTLAQIVQLLYNLVDRIYIGHLPEIGELALTGVGITFPIILLIAAFTGLLGTGAVPLFSIARGNKQEEEAENILGNSFVLLLVASVVLFFVGYFLRKPILFLFGASEESYVFADQYLRIYLFGTVFAMLSTGLNGYINAQGFPKIGMLTTVMGAAINIILDPIFIFTFEMGVAGAALATVLSQIVSALWVLKFLTGKQAILKLRYRAFRLEAERVKRMVGLGTTLFIMQGSNCLVQVVCNKSLQGYGGDLYVGIMTVLNSVREMLALPVMGISSGAQPVLGFNYGAGEKERVKEGIRFMTLIGGAYTVFAWLAIMLFPHYIFRIFTTEEAMILEGTSALNIYFFGFVFMAFQFSGQSVFQALGMSKKAIFFSMLRKVIIVVPLTIFLPLVGFGVDGVFLAEPISNLVGGLICFLVMWKTVYQKL